MIGSLVNAYDKAVKLLFVSLILTVPLAIWKIVEIVIWLAKHLTFSVKWGI